MEDKNKAVPLDDMPSNLSGKVVDENDLPTSVSSPKSKAPSKTGGESGARITPSTSTLPSAGSELGSWTTEANPLKPAERPIQVPVAKGKPMPIQEAPSDIKLFEDGKPIRQEPKKTKLGTVAFDINEVKRNVAENPISPIPLTADQAFNEVKNLEMRTSSVDNLYKGQSKIFNAKKAVLTQYESELNAIKQQVEKAKAEGDINTANRLIESAQPIIKQYDSQAKELRKQAIKLEYLEDRKKTLESDMIGISENQQYTTNQWQALNSGLNTLTAGALRAPSFVYNTMIALQNKIAKETGVPIYANPQTDGYLQQAAKYFEDNAEAYSKVIEKKKQQADYSIQNLFENGEYAKAFNLISESVMESAPTTAAIALGGIGGVGALGTTLGGAAVFGSQTFEENKKKGIDDNTNYINSWVNGTLEGIFEATGTLQIVKHGADLFKKEGVKAVEETAKTIWQQVYGKVAKKMFPATSAVMEGVSEAETAFTQNYVNMISGVDAEYKKKYNQIANSDMNDEEKQDALSMLSKKHLFQGVPDAFYVGAAMGGGMGLMQPKQGYTAVNNDKKNEIKKAQETLDNLNKTLTNPLVSADAKDIIQSKADAEAERISLLTEEDDRQLRETLNKDEYEAVTNIQAKIETLEKSLDAIDDKDSKALVEQQIKELEVEKQDILSKPVTLKKNTSPTPANYGTINRNDGKGVVNLTKEEFEAEQANMQPKAEGTALAVELLKDVENTTKALEETIPKKDLFAIAVSLLPKAGVINYKDINKTGLPLSDYLNNPKLALERDRAKDIYEDIKSGKSVKYPRILLDENNKLLDGTNRTIARLANGETDFEFSIAPKGFLGKPYTESISEAYHKAKADGSNPELVKAVEELLTPKTTTNEKANEDGEQKRGKDGEENVTKSLQGEGEDGGKQVDLKENKVLGTEGAVTAAPNEEDINNKISVSGLREGYTVSRKTQEKTTKDSIQFTQNFDPRTADGQNSGNSFITTIEKKGKKYRVVGLRMNNPKTIIDGQAGRSGMSYAMILDDGNLPSNIDELLIKKAIQEGKNLYEDIVKLEDSDFKMPSEYKPKAEAAPNVEASSVGVGGDVESKASERVVYDREPTADDGVYKILGDERNVIYRVNPSNGRIQEYSDGFWSNTPSNAIARGTARKQGFQKIKDPSKSEQSLKETPQAETPVKAEAGSVVGGEVNNNFPNSQVQETVYHNTTTDFEEFKQGKDGSIHFGDKEAARQRTKNAIGEKYTKEAKINIENLVEGVDSLDFDPPANATKEEKAIYFELLKKANNETKEHIIALYKNGKITLEQANKLIDEGWSLQKIYKELFNADGYYYINQAENKGSKSYVVFNPNQIKIINQKQSLKEAPKTEQQAKPITNEKPSQKTDQEGSTEGGMLEEPRDGGTQDEGGKESTELRAEEKEVEPTQAEGVKGNGKVGGYNPRFKSAKKIQGEETTIEMPDGETREAEYMVVESDDILASHNEVAFSDTEGFPKTADGRNANSRNYKGDNSAQLKVNDDARNLKSSIVISDTATTDGGVPIISTDGIVISGNGRTMAIKLSQKIAPEKYAAYKADLLRRAVKFGIDPKEIANMKNPVLVKIDKNVKDYSVKTFDDYNGKYQKEESPTDKAIKRSSIIKADKALKGKILDIVGRHETMSDLFENRQDRKELFNLLVANNIILKQETPKYLTDKGEFTPEGKDIVNDILIATILNPKTLEATNSVKAFRNKIINSLPVLSANYKLGDNSLEQNINDAVLLQSKIASMGSQEDFWTHLGQIGMFDVVDPDVVVINRMINNGADKFKKFIVAYNKSMEIDEESNLFGGDEVLTKQQVIDNLKQSNLNENERKVIANLEELYAANEQKRPIGNVEVVGGNEAEQETPKAEQPKPTEPTEKLTDPKNASDLAKTYRNKFGFTPQGSVWAARLFDAKAAFMSKVLGISKEDYYSQYWFGVNEEKGGLSQSERNKNALSSVEETAKELKGANIGNVLGGIKAFRGQQKGMTGRWFTPSKKFAEIFSNSVKGKAKLDAEVIEQTVLGNVLDFPYNVTEYARISDKLADMFGVTQQEIRDALSKTNESLGKSEAIRIHSLLEDKNFGDLLASKGIDYVKAKENLTKTESVDTFLKISNKPQEQLIAEAYHKAKIDGSNPALIESVESVIAEKIANQEGGLSQLTLPDGRKVNVKSVSAEVVNGFYSNTENALGQVKQEKMSGNQWATQLLSRGANKEEMQFTGLEAFLKENAAKSISKADIQQFLKDNRIQVVEVVKGEAEDAGYDNFQKQVEKAERKFGVRINIDENPMDGSPNVQISGEKLDNMTDDEIQELQDEVTDFVMAEAPDTENNTKFSQYQLEGEKENYKEVLVTMPFRKELSKAEQKELDELYSINSAERLPKQNARIMELIDKVQEAPSKAFVSSHFEEPNILVHLRMNTRVDAEGNKVLFLEEIQSDWGQKGKREGFKESSFEWDTQLGKDAVVVLKKMNETAGFNDWKGLATAMAKSNDILNDFQVPYDSKDLMLKWHKAVNQERKVPTAPFVTDTNAWTKLGLKYALKEAVKQGATKIAWTTGEQQNDRYDLSKQVSKIDVEHVEEAEGVFFVDIALNDGEVENLEVENGVIRNNPYKGQKLDAVLGKEYADKILSTPKGEFISLTGNDLKLGGKGMKGFYGSPTEGSLGIVGNVAKSLFKQEPKTVEINSYEKVDGRVENIGNIIQDPSTNEWVFFDLRDSTDAKNVRFENKEDAIAHYDNLKKAGKVKNTTQHSIDITPELKAEAEQGQPLFQDRKGSWTKDAARMKRIINMYEKADSTTAVHEMLGHDYLDRIIEASATNKESEADLRTIAEEYIKATKSKEKVEDVIKALKDFDVENNKTAKGTSVHEWFATQAEQYFATEKDVKRETPQQSKMAKIFEAFRAHLAELYDIMNKTLIAPSEPMKQVFRKVFGEENFNKAEEIRAENVEAINTLNAAALEGNRNKSKDGVKSLMDYLKQKGLGQPTDEVKQKIWNAASTLIANKEAKRYNVTDALKKMAPAIEDDIESMRKVLQEIGTTGKLRQGAESILANPNISDEVKEKVAKMSEYTPETLRKVGLGANEVIDYYIAEAEGEVAGLEKIKSLLDKGEFDGYTEKVAIQQSLIGMYNKLAKFGATEQIRKEALNNAVDVAEQYINQGTSLGRAINAYKLLGSLTTEGRLVWAKRQTNKYVKPAHEKLKENIRDLKAELKDAYKQVDYFFEQTLGREETEGQYKEAIAQYQAEIDALKARKPREPKPSKTAYKGVKATREFKESDLANFAKDILAGGLFQDMETMTAPQKLAYGIMEKKPTNISEFAKAFGRYLGKKIDPKELESLYVQTRDLLITKDLAFADGLSTNEQLRADLDGLEVANKVKIEELERKKAEAEAKIAAKAKKGEKKEHSEELADFVIKDAKKAMNGAIAKQKTYLDEILKALKEKTADVINKGKKDKIQTAKVSEVEAIKFALDAINNGGADANMWNDAVEQVKAKIKADNDLSQQDKDDLNLYLNDYTAFLYDNLLSENKIFKVIREKLIQSGYGNGTLVNWKQIIEGADGDVNNMREIIQKLVKNQLKDYDNVQVEKVLDAIVYKYDQEINKQRKKIADKYIEKELGDKKSTKKKTAAVQGKIGKLLVENRLGILKDGNEDMLNELAAAKGLKSMSEKDWKRAAELAENVENSADGNLKNRAIEEMTAFIASKQPLSFMNTASSLRFAGLLGRATTVAVNLISGAIEGGLLAGGRAIRGNTSFIKESFKGVSKGGFKDILFGGGINQASKTSVEVNSSGMPYFRALEYYEGKGKKIIKSGKYVGRVLDATDSVFQEMFGSGYDRVYLEKQFKLENPNATKAEIDQMVNDALSKTKYDEFYAQALQDVIKSGQKPTLANVKRRTYEILRESQVSQMAIDLSDLESREKTFKSEFKENRGLATLFGSMLASSSNVSRKVVEPVAEYMFKLSGYNEKQAAELAKKIGDVIPNKIMPFTRGVSNVIEKALEKDIVYGLTKSLIVNLGVNKMPTTTMEEKMAKARAEEKVKDLATTAIFTNILIYGVGSLLYAASKAWDDDEEKEGRNPEKTGVYPIQSQKTSIGSTSSAKERATPENTLVLFGQKIPLKWLGSIGAELSLTANINKALTKDSKSSGAEKVANAALDISESYMQQSFMMSQNDKQSVVALLRDENVNWDKVEDYLINDMISYGGSYILWSGFVNQSLQGARYLSGDKSYQEAKTISEKLQKQVGLAGITYDNKKPNYMGRPLEATEVNREGIQGFLGMFSKSYKSPTESWVENIGYKESLVGRKSKQLATIQSESFVSPTNEQYDDFTDKTRKLIGKGIEFAYGKRNEVVVPLDVDGGLEVNKKTGKAYTKDEYTNELLNDMSNAIEGYKRTELVNRLDANKYDRDEYLSKLEDYYYKLEDAMYEFYREGSIDTDADKKRFSDKVNSILPPPPEE